MRDEIKERDQAQCFTGRIKSTGYSGDFPCADYDQCPGCDHALVSCVTRTGFPFQLESELGRGGFARVFKEMSCFLVYLLLFDKNN